MQVFFFGIYTQIAIKLFVKVQQPWYPCNITLSTIDINCMDNGSGMSFLLKGSKIVNDKYKTKCMYIIRISMFTIELKLNITSHKLILVVKFN